MKDKAILFCTAICIFSLLIVPVSFADPSFSFEQETYLFQKEQSDGPWKIILPQAGEDEEGEFTFTSPFAKFEYYNTPVVDEESGENQGFCFDLKGYGLPENVEYALIYYEDPPDGIWGTEPPQVYVLGTATAPWEVPS
mgnify:CR=1 FL=1